MITTETTPSPAAGGDRPEVFNKLRDWIKDNVIRARDSNFRQSYERDLEEWEQRYQARRSVSGLQLGPDPRLKPKRRPWPGCADLGFGLDSVVIQQIHPKLVQAFSVSPLFESHKLQDDAFVPADDIDQHYQYHLVTKGEMSRVLDEALLMSLKLGDPVIKPYWENKRRYVEDRRMYLAAKRGKTDVLLADPSQKPIEVMNQKTDLVDLIWNEIFLNEPTLRQTALALGQQDKITDHETVMALCGYTIDNENRTVTRQEPGPLYKGAEQKDVIYHQREFKKGKWVQYWSGVDFELYHPRDVYWPIDAKTNDTQVLPWIALRLKVSESWLRQRIKGQGDEESELPEYGFEKEVVERAIAICDKEKDVDEEGLAGNIEILEVYGRAYLSEEDEAVGKEQEVIGWYAVKSDEVLGYIENFNCRNPTKYIRPLFPIQVRPEDSRYAGNCVPASIMGYRDVMDAIINQGLDAGSIANAPPLIVTSRSLLDDEKYAWGPGARFFADAASFVKTWRQDQNMGSILNSIQTMTLMVQQLWGSNETMSGVPSQTTQTKTLGELQMSAAYGSVMFDKQVQSVAQSLNGMIEYIRYLYQRHAGAQGFEYVSKEKIKQDRNSQGFRDKLLVRRVKESDFEGTIITQVRTKMSELQRVQNMMALEEFAKKLAVMQFPAMRSPKFMYGLVLYMRDKYNLEDLPMPTLEEIYQESARMMAMAQQMQDKEKFEKIIGGVKNPKLRSELMAAASQEGLAGRPQPGQNYGTGIPPTSPGR